MDFFANISSKRAYGPDAAIAGLFLFFASENIVGKPGKLSAKFREEILGAGDLARRSRVLNFAIEFMARDFDRGFAAYLILKDVWSGFSARLKVEPWLQSTFTCVSRQL